MCIFRLVFVSVLMSWSLRIFALTSIVPSAVDPVTKALEYVEEIAKQKDNCSFGPSLDLQYNKERWSQQAEVAVHAANLLTTLSRTGLHIRGFHTEDEDLLYSVVLANVQNHPDVFGSAIAFKTSFYRDYRLFCPYAFRAPDFITAKDLSIGYNYTMEETDWFHIPYTSFRNYTFALTSTMSSSSSGPSDTVFSEELNSSCTICKDSYNPEMFSTDMNSTQSPLPSAGSTDNVLLNTFTTYPYPSSNSTNPVSSTATMITQGQDFVTNNSTEIAVSATDTSTLDATVNTANADSLPVMNDDPALLEPSDIPILESMKFVDISNGYWTKPYFDCGGGDVWMVTFSMPFFWSNMDPSTDNPSGLDVFTFAGVTTIDISLDQLDIYQCPSNDTENSADGEIFDPFVGTHRCKNTTQCLHISGQGFQRGAYLCECKPGYYFPPDAVSHTDDTQSPAFFGRTIEEEYNKKAYGEENEYDSAFDCLPCRAGCDECDDDSPCVLEPSVVIRWCFVAVNALCLILLIVLALFTYGHREVRVFKAASPCLLYVILLGSGLCYCETIVSVAVPLGVVSCQGLLWFRYVGFCLAYGALLFKTWRITKVFTVRSAKPVRITDKNLFLRIGILLAIFVIYLSAWTFLSPSKVEHHYNRAGLKYYRCSENTWNYAGQAGELLLLAWGMYLCFKVRKAPSSFNESKFISVSIYNEALISIFAGIVSFVIPAELSGPDTLLIINFCRLHATFTVMVALLFVSKIVMFYQTNTGKKKKTDERRSQHVFTIDNSTVTIDFSRENPEVSDELSRLRQELVAIKEIARLVPIDQSIVNRYKLAITSFSLKKDRAITTLPSTSVTPSYRSRRDDAVAKEHVVSDSNSGMNTPSFPRNSQKMMANGIANVFLRSLGNTSLTRRGSVSSRQPPRDVEDGVNVRTAQTFNECEMNSDDDPERTDEAMRSSASTKNISSLKESGGHSADGTGSVESFQDTTQATVHRTDNQLTSSASRRPHGNVDLERISLEDPSDEDEMSIEMFASMIVERILKDCKTDLKQKSIYS